MSDQPLVIHGHRYVYWWDRKLRSWMAYRQNADGYSVGEAITAAERDMLLVYIGLDAAAQPKP